MVETEQEEIAYTSENADTANHNEYSEDLQVVVPKNVDDLKNVITINDVDNKKKKLTYHQMELF